MVFRHLIIPFNLNNNRGRFHVVIKLFSLYSRETSYTNTTFNFQDRSKKLKLKHGKVPVGNITVDMVLGGMRGMTGLHNRNLIA
ncbi:citrate synthase-like protein [Arabidopsis thaliana]|uniref:Citrate synthase-like protein n=1 Tax=Arabidopsis thaliana TaxID=3702 RepID=Q8RV72_ARATH|nr:citrate synthase-like protein [Arabidopsis thaliana]AAM15137.1 putative citrate synthetase [Arabidopsis thaliana]AAM15244.1 putative citrate synthetase [Arabidopsis thaliana]AEC06169.1 citrate synthase-like protein [Arabidopsis thaliana]|eukprot:NP_001318210.1 citrate synthase-like protein [Arabidopsis thaliana]